MGQLNCVRYKTEKLTDDGKCLSESRYRRFPNKLKKPPFSLLLEKYVFPTQDYDSFLEQQRSGYGSRINSCHWWCDAQFPPNDDTTLFVTGEPFGPRPFARRESAKPLRATSTVVRLKLDEDGCDEAIFSKTRSAVYPKLSMHPSGSYIGLVNDKTIKIEAIKHNEELIKSPIDPNGRCLTECLSVAFAPDGKQVATLLLRYLDDVRLNSLGFYIDKFELVVSVVDDGCFSCEKVVNLDEKVPRFYSGTLQDEQDYIEHMTCKWSPDGRYIAVCSPRSLCLFSRKLRLYVNVISEILKFGAFQSSGYKFDFDPRSHHHLLAVGTIDRFVYFVNSESKKILTQSNKLNSTIECLQYHPFGKFVAVGTGSCSIYLLEPSDGTVLHHLDMRAQILDLQQIFYLAPTFTHLSFTTTGEQLVTATFDAKVRVFQMPQDLSLFHFCKWTIMTLVPQANIKNLPLPKKLISKLLPLPVLK